MAKQDTNGTAAPRVPRRIKVILGLSLALNLLVIGVIAGAVLRGAPSRGPAMTNYAMPYVRALPGEDRRAIFRELRSAETSGLPDHGARKALYSEMIAILSADAFDRDAAESVLARQGKASVAVMTAAQQAWLEQVSQMGDTARKDYAQRVGEVLSRRRKNSDKR